MKYQVAYTKVATKKINKLDEKARNRIENAIDNMLFYFNGKSSKIPDVKMLKGKYAGIQRLRVGSYRVIFKLEKNRLIILIIDLISRKDASLSAYISGRKKLRQIRVN